MAVRTSDPFSEWKMGSAFLFEEGKKKKAVKKKRFPYLHDGRGSEELLDKGAGGEVVTQADGQVL